MNTTEKNIEEVAYGVKMIVRGVKAIAAVVEQVKSNRKEVDAA